MLTNKITTQNEVRKTFWQLVYGASKPRRFYGKPQNDLPADIRASFCDYVDQLARNGTISERLASRVTL